MSDAILAARFDMLPEVKDIFVMSTPFTLEFVLAVPYSVDVITSVLALVINSDMLPNESVSGTPAGMTSVEGTLSAP